MAIKKKTHFSHFNKLDTHCISQFDVTVSLCPHSSVEQLGTSFLYYKLAGGGWWLCSTCFMLVPRMEASGLLETCSSHGNQKLPEGQEETS